MNRPAIMGIVNVTPDSFSGDGRLAEEALKRAKQLADDGADILDIGAESTRPGATPLSPEEEWARLKPVVSAIADAPWRTQVRVSIDTRHPETAAQALAFEVDIINDVGGLADSKMAQTLSKYECDIVVMHALGVPANPEMTLPNDCDVIKEVLQWKNEVTKRARSYVIAPERLIYDPGIGFGKTAEQSLALIERAGELKQSGGRWLYGHSRKSFMNRMAALPAAERDPLTLQCSKQLAVAGIDYLRVHAVAAHVLMFEELCT